MQNQYSSTFFRHSPACLHPPLPAVRPSETPRISHQQTAHMGRRSVLDRPPALLLAAPHQYPRSQHCSARGQGTSRASRAICLTAAFSHNGDPSTTVALQHVGIFPARRWLRAILDIKGRVLCWLLRHFAFPNRFRLRTAPHSSLRRSNCLMPITFIWLAVAASSLAGEYDGAISHGAPGTYCPFLRHLKSSPPPLKLLTVGSEKAIGGKANDTSRSLSRRRSSMSYLLSSAT